MWHEPADREVGHVIGDRVGRERTIGTKPLRRPVQRAEKRARGDRRVAGGERPPGDAGGDQRTNPALVAIAFGDDDRATLRGQRIDLEMRGRSFDFRDQAQGVAHGELAQTLRQRAPPVALGGGQRRQQAVQRSVLAEEEDLVLAAEVVIEVRRRQIGGHRDVAHAGGGEAAAAEDLRRGAQDGDATGLSADRTAVRKLNHRSILAHLNRGPRGERRTGISAIAAVSAVKACRFRRALGFAQNGPGQAEEAAPPFLVQAAWPRANLSRS